MPEVQEQESEASVLFVHSKNDQEELVSDCVSPCILESRHPGENRGPEILVDLDSGVPYRMLRYRRNDSKDIKV